MTSTEQSANSRPVSIAKAGLFALLGSRLPFKGSGARRLGLTASLAVLALAFTIVIPAIASAEACPNENLRVENNSTELPDCRAFERVSPVFTATGAPRVGATGLGPAGTTVALEIENGSVEGLEGFPNEQFPRSLAKASRTASGWVTVAEALPTSEYEAAEFSFGGLGLEAQTNAFLGRRTIDPSNQLNLYLRRPDRSLAEVGPLLPPTTKIARSGALAVGTAFLEMGSSSDMSHLLFRLSGDFWSFDATEEQEDHLFSLYEYVGIGNTQPMLVGVNDAGEQISDCGTIAGGEEHYQDAISADGNTVFFTAFSNFFNGRTCTRPAPPVNELFARIDNGEAGARTVAISQPSEADCAACYANKQLISGGQLADAEFVGASEDGAKVFFTTKQPLLGGDASGNLYEYDFEAPVGERLVRVSAGDGSAVSAAAGVAVHIGIGQGIHPVVSPDGSHVYFCATGVLTRTPNGEGEAAEAGASNLYVFELDARYPKGRIAFVAQMSPLGSSVFPLSLPEIQTTPDGRFLVFTSRRDLTPDDTTAAQQVFEYDAQTGDLTRVSIGEHGYNHDGNVPLQTKEEGVFSIDDATIPIATEAGGTSGQDAVAGVGLGPDNYWSRLPVSADGSYVFFESSAALTPLAKNEAVIGEREREAPAGSKQFVLFPIYAKNVYEYHDGRISLIADGAVKLVGTDPSGQDLFLNSTQQLVPQGADNTAVFDARIDGGFPAPVGPPSCSGEACQGALSSAPTLLSPGSEFQAGETPPLVAPAKPAIASPKKKKAVPRCKKGFVKNKKHKCVRAKARKAGNERRAI